ncbi:hypothetical protein [Mycobacterium sp. URHB0044]|uniref:hypothetical protein n=1 Tax=Mycobacterium sp. URHB0044 TaxID=1380386 RepID=UPI0012DFC8CB|nr:hypothetical protein [Mycobacterium sp. URHB0044]
MEIRSAEALARLFDEFDWFHCGQCVSLSPLPNAALTPARVEMVLRDFGTGGLDAGDLRTYRTLSLTATDVREWSALGETVAHSPDHAMDGAEPVAAASGFGFDFDVPTPVRVVARAFEATRLPDVTERVKPWTSDRDMAITAPGARLPSPADWVLGLAKEAIEVAWRIYGGPAVPVERVPRDYTGWFLERPSRLGDHDGGVFFSHVGDDRRVVALHLENQQVDPGLWRALCGCVARMFPAGEFRSGNCRFTADQWSAHLKAEPTIGARIRGREVW